MRQRLSIFLVALGTMGMLYSAWALHRVSDRVLVDDVNWLRPRPYPDPWLERR